MKLILCAGDRHISGFTTHDIQGKQDIICDLFDIGLHVKPGSCEEVHFTHALEHFPTAQTQEVLALVRSLIAPGGKLYLEVPNFGWHAKLVAEGRERDAVYYAFGGQLDEYDFHKTAFTKTILEEELAKAGFNEISVQESSSLSAWATK